MNDILAEINLKRKSLSDPVGTSRAGPSKYLKKADLEKARAEEERLRREEAERPAREAREAKAKKAKEDAERAKKSSLARLASSPHPTSGRNTPDPSTSAPTEGFNISPEECIRRLRAKGQPIRLFGETDKERRLRLRALELLEERAGGSAGANEFKKALQEMESGMDQKDVEKRARALHRQPDDEGDGPVPESEKAVVEKKASMPEEILDLNLFKTDRNKLYPLIYYALKGVWKEWGEALEERPEAVKRTHQGKVAATTQIQSGQYLKPLFKQLRQRSLEPDVLRLLAEIVHHMQSRQYQKANDAYLRLSIGNAAWPIGVTNVGIHERSAREKIQVDNIAHVLNDEVSRKYIQSVKRLLTFSQTIRPPDDISQLMG